MTTSSMTKKLSMATAGAAFFVLGAVGSAQAAGFTGAYDPSNWTFTNTNADGFVDTSNAPASISITGGNQGGGFGQTTYTITSAKDGLLSFDWNYETKDVDGPSFDPFGFILNNVFTQLTTNGGGDVQSGTFSTQIAQGDIFGFGINTVDNILGAATVNVSDFKVVPEPASAVGLLALGAMGAGSMLKRKQKK